MSRSKKLHAMSADRLSAVLRPYTMRPMVATFGPWSEHAANRNCRCNVCQ